MTSSLHTLLSLDYSTSAVGWAKFDLETHALVAHGVIKPDFKVSKRAGTANMVYPQVQTLKLQRLADQVISLLTPDVKQIVIEEINRGKARITQKILDGGHFLLLARIPPHLLSTILYVDSDGLDGWRSVKGLNLRLSEEDKKLNKANKRKKSGKVVSQKTLACRWVNAKYGLALDEAVTPTDADEADAIGLGYYVITKLLKVV